MRVILYGESLALLPPTVALAQANTPKHVAQATEAAMPFGATAPVDPAALEKITGQADLAQVVQAQNRSTVSNNSVSGNSNTGTISFDSGAFQNLNGLSLLSANTGNNVSINSSLNVNVAINH